LNISKAGLELLLGLPIDEYSGISFFQWAQSARCIVVLYRLTTYTDPAWDRQAVRDTADILLLLDRAADRTEQASEYVGEQSDDDLFRQLTRMLRALRAWVGSKIGLGTENQPTYGFNNGRSNGDTPVGDNPISSMATIDFENDMWLEEFLGRP
jgi:hypothetical protein